ncbi:BgTH12-02544 [Blumeria graminis f. sp. triticale]|uniref:Peroxin-7 n=3 Tax=Blumeria graminis TaxID=34373 RepID=A0A381L3N8_BLUGR|nr:Peroxisomal signal receptor [Blumeria graminis f. sp. tritici 96224]CAD6502309.1 BgTH12-02544 [Blumeria graminis f. sp. triticale]VDB86375.1 Bgt-2619 [Blumeria graminis f. sp. tritici]
MLEYRTQGYNGYAIKYSPFFDNRLAAATAANFGLVGNGRLYILRLTDKGIIHEKWFDTQDSIYDTAWSEIHENQLLAACGDGSVKLFDTLAPDFPVQNFHEHNKEVYAVSWNQVTKDTFLSSSWDGTIKIWSPNRPQSLLTLPTHSCTYSSTFSPHSPSIVSSVSSDSHLRIFDLRTSPSSSNHLVTLIPIHTSTAPNSLISSISNPSECLTHDWNKYNGSVIATGGVDQVIRTFDLKAPKSGPVMVMRGHRYAIRKLAWSPHVSDIIISGSYDMSVRIWSDKIGEIGVMMNHTEFATGVDWCLFGAEGWCASTAWDERILVWDVKSFIPPQYSHRFSA